MGRAKPFLGGCGEGRTAALLPRDPADPTCNGEGLCSVGWVSPGEPTRGAACPLLVGRGRASRSTHPAGERKRLRFHLLTPPRQNKAAVILLLFSPRAQRALCSLPATSKKTFNAPTQPPPPRKKNPHTKTLPGQGGEGRGEAVTSGRGGGGAGGSGSPERKLGGRKSGGAGRAARGSGADPPVPPAPSRPVPPGQVCPIPPRGPARLRAAILPPPGAAGAEGPCGGRAGPAPPPPLPRYPRPPPRSPSAPSPGAPGSRAPPRAAGPAGTAVPGDFPRKRSAFSFSFFSPPSNRSPAAVRPSLPGRPGFPFPFLFSPSLSLSLFLSLFFFFFPGEFSTFAITALAFVIRGEEQQRCEVLGAFPSPPKPCPPAGADRPPFSRPAAVGPRSLGPRHGLRHPLKISPLKSAQDYCN
ncbi:basic proline-rich protein-like [Pseudopipra pipra]|uniref:basic proline-rich protein-like n=1 Tax=Pseudopipra pipra TaxID=415032 RepID=UPI003138DEAF